MSWDEILQATSIESEIWGCKKLNEINERVGNTVIHISLNVQKIYRIGIAIDGKLKKIDIDCSSMNAYESYDNLVRTEVFAG